MVLFDQWDWIYVLIESDTDQYGLNPAYTKDTPPDAGSYSHETEGIWKALLLRVG